MILDFAEFKFVPVGSLWFGLRMRYVKYIGYDLDFAEFLEICFSIISDKETLKLVLIILASTAFETCTCFGHRNLIIQLFLFSGVFLSED